MSKHLLSFLLSELSTVRVICKKCETTTELSLGNLGTRFKEGKCRFCNREFFPPDKERLILDLDNLMTKISEFKEQIQIEFVIPMPLGEMSRDQPK